MTKKYFGTDGIRGPVNQGNINGEMFFKFGLAAGTFFKNQKKTKQTAIIAKRHKVIRIYFGTRIGLRISICWNERIYTRTIAN